MIQNIIQISQTTTMSKNNEQISGTSDKGLESIRQEYFNQKEPVVNVGEDNQQKDTTCDKTCDKACAKDQTCDKRDQNQSKAVDIDITNEGRGNKSISKDKQQRDGHQQADNADGQRGIDIDLTGQGADQDEQPSKMDQAKEKSGDMAQKTKQKTSEGMDTAKEKTGEASQVTKDAAGGAMDKTKEGAHSLKDKISAGLHKTKELFTGIDGDQSRDPSGLPDMQADQRKEQAERKEKEEQ
jgi:hypothetical protein